MGRPTSYTSEIALEICSRLAGGESLRAICCDSHLPHRDTVRLWVVNDTQGFHGQYARAREAQVEHYADEIVEISDETANDTLATEHGEKPNSEWIARSRLRVDTRKWLMSKLAPKKYGEKIDVTSDGQSLNLTAEERAAKLTALAAAAAKRKQEQEDGEDLL